MLEKIQEFKPLTETVVASTVIGSLMDWLPPIAAAVGILYYFIIMSETGRGRAFIAFVQRGIEALRKRVRGN